MASDNGTFAIEGLPRPSNVQYLTTNIPYTPGMPVRRELTDWFQQMQDTGDEILQRQWTLFVLGLERFKSLPVDDKLSYFQVAGIHGYPEQPWDGAPDPKPDPPGNPDDWPPGQQPFGGYCHHNTIAFPTWHRPYMLLYEQCIWMNMKKVINDWKLEQAEATRWHESADQWRLPYWDWARKQSYTKNFAVPYLFSLEVVPVYLPFQKPLMDYSNPLWKFDNPEKGPDDMPLAMGDMPPGKEKWNIKDDVPYESKGETLYWSKCSGTSRWGITKDSSSTDPLAFTGLSGINDFNKANQGLANMDWYKPGGAMPKDDWSKYKPGNLADAVNRMFSDDYNGTWGTFSSTKWYREYEEDVRTGYMSLEYIHNNVHNICGGSTALPDKDDPEAIYGLGHMCDVPVAAFDPIFWMHHCNIDRYLAMWQCINWTKWWDQKEPQNPDPQGRMPLPDFLPDEALIPFHTENTSDPSTGFWTSDLARDWTKLGYTYDDIARLQTAILPDGDLSPSENTTFFGPKIANLPDDKAWFEDYLINVVYDRYALGGSSYTIKFYLSGDNEISTSAQVNEKNFIGQIYSFGGLAPARGSRPDCANCGAQNDGKTLSKGQVPISIPLMRQAADTSFDAINTIQQQDVATHLQQHLSWKFVQAGGTVRPAQDFPETKISVWGGRGYANMQTVDGKDVWLPPTYETKSYRPIYEATQDKAGGLQPDDENLPARMFEAMALIEQSA